MRPAVVGTALTDIILVACGLITGTLIARLLEAEGRGALAAVLFWPQWLAAVGLLSLNEAVTYRVGSTQQSAGRVATGAWLAFGLGLAVMAVGYCSVPYLLGDTRRDLWPLAQLYLVYVPSSYVALVILAEDQGRLQFTRFNLMRLTVPLLYLVGLGILWIFNSVSVSSVVIANCLASVSASLMRLLLHAPGVWRRPVFDETRMLLQTALRFHGVTLVSLIAAQADQMLVLAMWDDRTLGIYVVALTVASSGLTIVSGAVQKVLFPHLAQAASVEIRRDVFARSVRHAMALLFATSAAFAAVVPVFVPLLFGEQFRPAVMPSALLLAAFLIVGVKMVLIQGLRGFGDGRTGLFGLTVGLICFVIVAPILAPHLGLEGIAVAMAMSNLAAVAYLAGILHRRYEIRAQTLWGLTPVTFAELWTSLVQLKPFAARAIP